MSGHDGTLLEAFIAKYLRSNNRGIILKGGGGCGGCGGSIADLTSRHA